MKKFIALLLALVMLLSFAACGETGNTATATKSGDDRVLQMYTSSALTSADWQTTTLTSDMKILWVQVFEGLYGMDESKGGYINLLADKVDVSEDGLTYTVTLVDAKFQNGEKLTAEDVKFSYEKAMENSRFNYVTSFINNIEAKDEKTVVFTLDYPYSAIAHTFWTIKVYSKKEYMLHTGPFLRNGSLPDTIVTSASFNGTKFEDGVFYTYYNIRSANDKCGEILHRNSWKICEKYGFNLVKLDQYSGWPESPFSPFRNAFIDAYENRMGQKPLFERVHGGIEVGMIIGAIPDMDAVGFAPSSHGAHTPKEYLEISGVKPYWDVLTDVMAKKD